MNAEIPNRQTVDQKTDHNQRWYCTFWNYGLKETPRSLPLLPLSLLASVWTPKTCDLTQEKCNFSNQTLGIQPLNEKRIFQEYKQ